MTTRKQIRDWFVTELDDEAVLGKAYSSRVSHFEDDSPTKYVSIYITDMRYQDELNNPLSEATLYIRFHTQVGTDDELDEMEARADQLIAGAIGAAPFDLSKEGIAYEGSSDETYQELAVEYSVLYRE